MLWNLFEISINAYEAFLMIYFLKSRLHFKKNSPIADCLCLISCTLFYSAYIYFDIPSVSYTHLNGLTFSMRFPYMHG